MLAGGYFIRLKPACSTSAKKPMRLWSRFVLLLATAVLTLLSMPGYQLDGFIFVALIPLFFALSGCSLRQSFWLGSLCGFVFFALLFYWVYALYEWAGLFIVPGHLALAGLMGFSWGLFGLAYALIEKHSRVHWLAVPAAWVVLEYLRSLTKFGFTWGYLSDALYQRPELLQIASLTGAWGLSFLIVLVNFLIYRTERRIVFGVAAAALVALTWAWGTIQLSTPSEGRALQIAIVHSNVAQRARSDPGQLNSSQELYLHQLERLRKVDLVVLPESILPAYLLRQEDVLAPYLEAAQRLSAVLIVGTIDHREGKLFNTAALISAEGQIADSYDKVQLVPFSTEYFPFIDLLRSTGLENIIGPLPLGALTAGADFQPLESNLGRLATPICFESIFPQIGRAFVQNGAQALLVITNDAWFKGSFALEQHFAKAVLRAVEAGRFTVQAANGGISGVIDAQGRIRSATRTPKETILQDQIVLQDQATLYVQLGDWFVYLVGVGLLGLVFWSRSRARPGVALFWLLVSFVTVPVEMFTL